MTDSIQEYQIIDIGFPKNFYKADIPYSYASEIISIQCAKYRKIWYYFPRKSESKKGLNREKQEKKKSEKTKIGNRREKNE